MYLHACTHAHAHICVSTYTYIMQMNGLEIGNSGKIAGLRGSLESNEFGFRHVKYELLTDI